MSAVIAPAAGYPDTMHSEAEESKEGMALISWGLVGGGSGQVPRRNVEERRSRGADGSFTTSGGYFVAAQLELTIQSPVPCSPRSPNETRRGRVRSSAGSPLKAAL